MSSLPATLSHFFGRRKCPLQSSNESFNQIIVFPRKGLGNVIDPLLLQFSEAHKDEYVAGDADDAVEPEDAPGRHGNADLVEHHVDGEHGRPHDHGRRGHADPLLAGAEDLPEGDPGDGPHAGPVGEREQDHAEHLGDPLVREVVLYFVQVLEEEEEAEHEGRGRHDGEGEEQEELPADVVDEQSREGDGDDKHDRHYEVGRVVVRARDLGEELHAVERKARHTGHVVEEHEAAGDEQRAPERGSDEVLAGDSPAVDLAAVGDLVVFLHDVVVDAPQPLERRERVVGANVNEEPWRLRHAQHDRHEEGHGRANPNNRQVLPHEDLAQQEAQKTTDLVENVRLITLFISRL